MGLADEVERLRRENQQLQKTVAQLEVRVEELGLECEDLREICVAKRVSTRPRNPRRFETVEGWRNSVPDWRTT